MTALGDDAARFETRLPDGSRLVLAWSGITDVGLHRKHNEDSYVARYPVFAVADGMGGHSAGDFASARVVARLGELAGRDPVLPDAVDAALGRATDDILPMSEQSPTGIGTTVTGAVVALVDGTPAIAVFNVGDSRTYSFLDGELRRVTRDHSIVQAMVDAGLLTESQAEQHPDSNVITRAIGFEEDPVPDRTIVPITPGLRLLICSDGLTKELGDPRIAEILGAGEDAADTAARLVDAALGQQGRDNVSTVVLDVLEYDPGS